MLPVLGVPDTYSYEQTRKDKDRGNTVDIAKRILQSIEEDIQLEEIQLSPPVPDAKDMVQSILDKLKISSQEPEET